MLGDSHLRKQKNELTGRTYDCQPALGTHIRELRAPFPHLDGYCGSSISLPPTSGQYFIDPKTITCDSTSGNISKGTRNTDSIAHRGGKTEAYDCSYGKIHNTGINNNTRITSVFQVLTTVNLLLPTPVCAPLCPLQRYLH